MQNKYELTLWKRPECYMGETYENYFVGLGQNRDSDALERSNFQSALKRLGGESETIFIVRAGHWAVGWIEWIAIHKSDESAQKTQYDIEGALANYPVLNEDHFSELETEEANEVWSNCYDESERVKYIRENSSQFEFHDYSDMRACIRGEHFNGYASELIH